MTRFAILNSRITAAVLVVILVMGVSAYLEMPRSEDPGFVIRVAMVMTYFPGAGPERVEQLVTDRLEEAIGEMPELDFVVSESKTGVSVLYVQVQESYTEMRPIWDKLRRKVDRAARDLPDGVIGPIVNDEFGDVFGVVIGLTGDGFSDRELEDVADDVRRKLLRSDQIAKVDLYGVVPERIFVEFDNTKLAELGLSPGFLKQLLEQRNIVIPGGVIVVGPEEIALQPSGNFESVAELGRTVVAIPGRHELIHLEDIATIRRGVVDPPEARMHTNGEPSVGLAVSMPEGGNIIQLGAYVRETLLEVEAKYPYGVEFAVTAFQPEIVEAKVDAFVGNLGQAIAIVMAVMLLSLGLRTGLIVASLIPSAIISALLIMSWAGIGIDQISLAALIIALGMLVDNAIVMAESIMVQMQRGRSAFDAAIDSARELRISLLTSSLTTAAAFLPIYLAESAVGEYTSALFTVVTITLLSSWVLALTLVPMLCTHFLRVDLLPEAPESSDEFADRRGYRMYRRFLMFALRHRAASIIFTVGLFLFAMQGFRFIPAIFFPPSDRAMVQVEIELPLGTPLLQTEEAVYEIERFLQDYEGRHPGVVTSWSAFIGQGGPRFVLTYNPEPSSPNYAFMMVNTSSLKPLGALEAAIEAYAIEHLPEARVIAKQLSNGPPVKAPVEYRLMAGDDARLFEFSDSVKAKLASVEGVDQVTDDWGRRTKKLLVKVDQERARRAAVSSQDVAISLQTNLSGIALTEYREGDKIIPVVLRSLAADRTDVGKIESLNVYSTSTGRPVSLKQVADVEVAWEPAKITRRDRERTVTVSAELLLGYTSELISRTMVPWLTEEAAKFGLDFSFETGGDIEASTDANASINAKLPIAGLCIILLLVGQFNSLRRPAIILLTIPLGLIGVVVGLLAAKSYFGFMTFLGVVSLAGIVINNAIILLDRIKLEIEENGMQPQRAVVMAAERRMRPILLTTATTIGGLVPLWLGGGPMFAPMAIAILFGLFFATGLTLGVVPVLYSVFFRVSFKGVQ